MNDLEKRGGVWRQRRGAGDQSIDAGGEIIDPALNPEEALMAKEDEEGKEAADKGMTAAQFRNERKEGGRGKLDKAA